MRDFFVGLFGAVIGVMLSILLRLDGVGYWICLIASMYFCFYLFSNKNLAKQKIETDYGFKRLPISYRATVRIKMNPKALFGDRFKNGNEENKFILKLMNDPDLELDKDLSFFARVFGYTLICDENTGLSLIYDDMDKRFIDEIEEYGSFLECNAEVLKNKYNIESPLVNSSLVLDNGSIGRIDKIAPFGGMDGEPLSAIPIDAIIDALLRLSVYWGNPMNAIKRFPDTLQKYLDEHKIIYDTSNVDDLGMGIKFEDKELDKKYAGKIKKYTGMEIYDEKLYCHQFIGQHLIVSIAVKFGEKKAFV